MLKTLSATKRRQILLHFLGRIHCGLLSGIIFGALFDLLCSFGVTTLTAYAAFYRGCLFAIPAALSFYAVRKLKALWKYLLASIGICVLAWILLGHLGGFILTALLCVLRARARLAEEEEGSVRSLFDYPVFPALGLFVFCFFLSAVVGLPQLQKLSIFGGIVYLLICLLYKGTARIDYYLTLNHNMHNLPVKRIQRIAGAAVAGGVLLTAFLLLPFAIISSGEIRIELPDRQPRHYQNVFEQPQATGNQGTAQTDFLKAIAEEPAWQIPPFITNSLLAIIGVALLIGMAALLRQLLKNFQHSYTDSQDLVQFISKQDSDYTKLMFKSPKCPSLWDRSPNAVVRRKYRKTVLKAVKDVPAAWMSPEELEAWAGIDQKLLHVLYEKARYSETGCTQEEAH